MTGPVEVTEMAADWSVCPFCCEPLPCPSKCRLVLVDRSKATFLRA